MYYYSLSTLDITISNLLDYIINIKLNPLDSYFKFFYHILMKEKNILYIFAFLVFLIFSALFIVFIESQIMQKQMSFYRENEKVITRLYQAFKNGQSLNEILKNENETVTSLGFYNFYGDSLFLYGDAPSRISRKPKKIDFNNHKNTIAIERDFLSPFDPMKRVLRNPEEINSRVLAENSRWTVSQKEILIRYVFIEMPDDMLNFYKIRFRIIQLLVVLLLFIIILFLVNIYKRNMNYRKHIESTERLVVLGTAARTLTHEIKNPLSIIRLQSTIIRRSKCKEHEYSLNLINEEISRITDLTERITDFLRHPAGYPEKMDVNEMIKDYISLKRTTLNLQLSEGKSFIIIDKNRFISIMDNLINNALESNSPMEDICITMKNSGKLVQIIVSDRGEGISEVNLSKLYDPFFTTKSKGSGLGLSIVISFVKAANGNISINSETNKGTTITLTFPLDLSQKEIEK